MGTLTLSICPLTSLLRAVQKPGKAAATRRVRAPAPGEALAAVSLASVSCFVPFPASGLRGGLHPAPDHTAPQWRAGRSPLAKIQKVAALCPPDPLLPCRAEACLYHTVWGTSSPGGHWGLAGLGRETQRPVLHLRAKTAVLKALLCCPKLW